MANLEEEAELISVTSENPETLSTFLSLGRDYLSDLPAKAREKFLRSILTRQGEPDRWLLILKHRNECIGFIHMKIDRGERQGWGFILEFHIVPTKRKLGWGRGFFNLIVKILKARGVKNIWLLTIPAVEQFWYSLGFKETGEIDRETGQKIMVISI